MKEMLQKQLELTFFLKIKNGEIHTPVPDCFLDGITRRTVIEIAQSKGIKVNERKIAPDRTNKILLDVF